jgi:hypothetical protein
MQLGKEGHEIDRRDTIGVGKVTCSCEPGRSHKSMRPLDGRHQGIVENVVN